MRRHGGLCAICDDDRGENVTCHGFAYDGRRTEGSRLVVVVVVLAKESDCCAFETVGSCPGWHLETHACSFAVQTSTRPHHCFREVTLTYLCVSLVACNPLASTSSLDPAMT